MDNKERIYQAKVNQEIANLNSNSEKELEKIISKHLKRGSTGTYRNELLDFYMKNFDSVLSIIYNNCKNILLDGVIDSEEKMGRIEKELHSRLSVDIKKFKESINSERSFSTQNKEDMNKELEKRMNALVQNFITNTEIEFLKSKNENKTIYKNAPIINYFKIEPSKIKRGNSAKLSWSVENSEAPVIIENKHEKGGGGVYNFGDSFESETYVNPYDSVEYTLIIKNSFNKEVKKSVKLQVIDTKKKKKYKKEYISVIKKPEVTQFEKTVFVFDICSSTNILEDLNKTGLVNEYNKMIRNINQFLVRKSTSFSFEIYKFIGDGFILNFAKKIEIENIIRFSNELIKYCNQEINNVIEYLEYDELPRKGITIGIDKGIIHEFELDNKIEYSGRAITVSCRLQSAQEKREQVNSILLSNKVFKEIKNLNIKKSCTKKYRTFKNITDNKSIKCYEIFPYNSKF